MPRLSTVSSRPQGHSTAPERRCSPSVPCVPEKLGEGGILVLFTARSWPGVSPPTPRPWGEGLKGIGLFGPSSVPPINLQVRCPACLFRGIEGTEGSSYELCMTTRGTEVHAHAYTCTRDPWNWKVRSLQPLTFPLTRPVTWPYIEGLKAGTELVLSPRRQEAVELPPPPG